MRADVAQAIKHINELVESTNKISDDLDLILDRGNKPSIDFVDNWAINARKAVQLTDELSLLGNTLAMDLENVTEDDTTPLLEAQERFRASQARQTDVIRRSKKALGLIP